jgi:glycosyltransferase involved in cell wall biosynthesis
MRSPHVSVLLPVRDGEPFLADALESVLSQTLSDFECIIVDDGSKDESPRIARAYAERDSRVRVLTSPRQRGVVAALRAAVDASRGPYLARMDADDIAHPARLALQAAALDDRVECAVVGSRAAYCGMDADGGSAALARYVAWQNSLLEPGEIRRDRFVESPLIHPTVLMRRHDLEAVGGYVDRGWPEDYDLWMRMLSRGREAAKLPEVLLVWRDHATRQTRTAPAYRIERFRLLKWHYLREWLRPGESLQVCGAGPTGRWWVRQLRNAGVHVSAVLDVDPRRAGRRCRGVPIIGLDGLRRDRGRLLVAVPSWKAREEIRKHLAQAGRAEERDFIAVA